MVVAKLTDLAEHKAQPGKPTREFEDVFDTEFDFGDSRWTDGSSGRWAAPAVPAPRRARSNRTSRRVSISSVLPSRRYLFGAVALVLVGFGSLPGAAQTDTTAETTSTTAAAEETSTSSTETTVAETTSSETTVAETTASTAAETTAPETTAPGSTSQESTTSTAAATTTTGSASTATTAASERQRVDAAAAQKASEVDAANATLTDLTNALAVLQRKVATQSAEVEIANQRLESALAIATAAEEQVTALEDQVTQLEYGLSDQAIRSFKGEVLDDALLAISENPNDALRMRAMLAKATQSDIDYVNVLTGVRDDLATRRSDAEEAVALAAESQRVSAEQLLALEEDRLAQGRLAASAESRLDHLLSETAALARLGADIDAGQDPSATEALVAQLSQAPLPAPSSARSISNTPSTQITEADIALAGNGIEVHVDIVESVRQLLIDAAVDGVELAGGGYRDSAGQIRARRANCGTSNYAIYEMRSSQCSPPTARPGRSMHEQGKAIDFTYNGKLIRSRSGAGWEWLNANANKYGLYNLPSEPWHWSVNGR
jgi:LAS superfamily LD-carboxypeptidase LdcB